MRPIEKRIAAVEARALPRGDASLVVVFCPDDVEPDAFRAQTAAKLGHDDFCMVVFVEQGSWPLH